MPNRRRRSSPPSKRLSIGSLRRREAFGGGTGLTEALKRRADLVRRIAEAEAQWLAAEESDRTYAARG